MCIEIFIFQELLLTKGLVAYPLEMVPSTSYFIFLFRMKKLSIATTVKNDGGKVKWHTSQGGPRYLTERKL